MKHLLLTTIAAVLVVGCGNPEADRALLEAVYDGNIEVVKQQLTAGADVHAKLKDGTTPLHPAASGIMGAGKEIVELLIAEGADVNVKNDEGTTPLHPAAAWGQKEIVKLLIAEGADVNAKSDFGGTPLDWAEVVEDWHVSEDIVVKKETADILRKHGGKTWRELEAGKTSAPNGELLNAQNKKWDYDLQIKTLNDQMADKDRAIDDIGRRLESTEEDRDRLINERNKLIAEKAELEKQFQDMLVLRQKVQQLKVELNQSLLRKHGGKTGRELKAEGK